MTELVLRRASVEDDAQMRELNETAFAANPKARADVTRWQWWTNPFGETLAWVWEDDGAIVAQYVAYCVPGRLRGAAQTFVIGVDAAVDPAYRGRQLFTPLSRALYDDANAHGTPLMAYPNEQSVRGITRAGWEEVARLQVHVLPLDDTWVAERFRVPLPLASLARRVVFRSRRERGVSTDVPATSPEDIDDLWDEVAPTVANGVDRAAAWWRWRYDAHPDAPYTFVAARDSGGRLRGAAALRVRDDLGGRFFCLLELLTADASAAAAIVGAIADGAAGEAHGAALTAAPGSDLAGTARAAGFRRLPARFEPTPIHFGVVPHPDLVPAPSSLQWSTCWGDLDHI
jgi:predicted N-acetyltransferase YhbS